MKHRVISARRRPHIVSNVIECWCHPDEDPIDDETLMKIHHDVEARPEFEDRMAVFSSTPCG